jgi:hypothetical protein
MHKIVKAIAHPEYIIELTFDDGATGCVDISSRLYGPMFEPLNDPDFFKKISVDEFGAICWPNQADLAPDVLYTEIQATQYKK